VNSFTMPEEAGPLGPYNRTRATESSNFSGRVDDSRTTPSVEILNQELGRLVAHGLPKLDPRLLPALFALHCVQAEIHGEKSEDQVLGLEAALRKATCLLASGGGPEWRRVDPRIADAKERAAAAEALIGLDPATRWLSRPARQRAAALAFLDPAYEVDTFSAGIGTPSSTIWHMPSTSSSDICTSVFPLPPKSSLPSARRASPRKEAR
jgi:hypothetical protein